MNVILNSIFINVQVVVSVVFLVALFTKKHYFRKFNVIFTVVTILYLVSVALSTLSLIGTDNGIKELYNSNNQTFESYTINYQEYSSPIRLPVKSKVSLTIFPINNTDVYIDPSLVKPGENKVVITPNTDNPITTFKKLANSLNGIPVFTSKPRLVNDTEGTIIIYIKHSDGTTSPFGLLTFSMVPYIPENPGEKLVKSSKTLELGMLINSIYVIASLTLYGYTCYKELENGKCEIDFIFIIPLIIMIWFVLIAMTYVASPKIGLTKSDNLYYPTSLFYENGNKIRYLIDVKESTLTWRIPIALAINYTRENPNQLVIAYLPSGKVYVGGTGKLQELLNYPVLYTGHTTLEHVDTNRTLVIRGEISMESGNYNYRIIVTREEKLSRVIKEIRNECVEEFPVGAEVRMNMYIANYNTIYNINRTMLLDNLCHITGDEIVRGVKVDKWIVNTNTTIEEVINNYGLPKHTVIIIPITNK